MPRDWLKNNQSLAAISTSAVPQHVRAFFKLTSLFPFWCQRFNTESWLLTKQAKSPCCTTYQEGYLMRDSTHMGTQNSSSSSLWIYTDQPPKLHRTERTVTKPNAIFKSAENTSFCNYSSFLLSLSLSLNVNPFSQPNCCLVPFLLSRLMLQ